MATHATLGTTLHYMDVGSGIPLVLLHALPVNGNSFEPQIHALKHKVRFIVPDFPGFGRSGPVAQDNGMDTLGRMVFSLMDALSIPTAVVGGVSMGGYVAMAMLREDAGRVQGLVLADTQVNADNDERKVKREELAAAVEKGGTELLVERQVPQLLSPHVSKEVRAAVEAQARQATPAGAIAAIRGMATRLDSKDMLARFSGPALVVVGENDSVTPRAKAEEMQELVARSMLAQIPGAGHLSNQENPEAFNAALDEFLSALSA